jgi:hypothetical protein
MLTYMCSINDLPPFNHVQLVVVVFAEENKRTSIVSSIENETEIE